MAKTEIPSFTVVEMIAMQEQLSSEVQTELGGLTEEQLNWKPNPEAWSVGQCIDHLINTNAPYFPDIERIIQGRKTNTIWQKLPFFPGFFGRLIINAANPDNVKKAKAPSVFKPTSSAIAGDVVDRFLKSQKELVDLMLKTEKLPLSTIMITSPVAAFVTYSLKDAYTIMALHNRRHFNQAKRVTEAAEFPRAAQRASASTPAV
jgi:CBS domain-containing protein